MNLLFFISLLYSYAYASISDCSNGQSLFQITKLGLVPDPPVIGKDVYLTLVFENPENEVSDGSVETTVSINGIPYLPSTSPLCDSTKCPIIQGENDRSTSSVWPDISGKVDTTIHWKKPSGELLLCLHTTVRVSTTENLRGREN